MKKYLFGLLVISLILAGPIYSQATGSGTNTDSNSVTDTNTDTDTNESILPDSVKMDLGIKKQKGVLGEEYLGGDPDHTLVHVLEDVEYERHEHSLIYTGDAGNSIASGSNFGNDPAVSWTTTKRNPDGTWPDGTADANAAANTIIDNNNNSAACTERMEAPGEYNICNSGARDVSEPSQEEDVVGGGDSATNTNTSTNTDPDSEGEGEGEKTTPKKKTVTAEQNLGVIVHDRTVPDVWVAFKEEAGTSDIENLKEDNDFATKVFLQMKEKDDDEERAAAEPFSSKESDFEEVSYLFIDEGSLKSKERDKEPWNKTVRVTTAGAMFNESNSIEIKSETLDTESLGEEDSDVRRVFINKELTGDKTPCVFVRRNVPFVVTAASVDNGTDRVQSTRDKDDNIITYGIEKEENSTTTKVGKQNGAYIFRVANYPRTTYKDQPEYYFSAYVADTEGNQTVLKIPVYVINSNASFETSGK